MPLPNIIAGPILRRVENNSVSVWIAFTQNVSLTLKIYEGDQVKVTASSGNFSTTSALEITTTSAQATTVQFGKRLWVAVVTAKTQLPLQTNKIYSYNVQFEPQDNPLLKGDLKTDGLLSSAKHEGIPHVPLGYKDNLLPSFLLPGAEPDKLLISQASCRKMHGHGQDALSYLDKVIKDNIAKPESRPQQLFLTGDQVYADDVPGPLLRFIGIHSDTSITLDEKVQIDKSDGTTEEIEIDITNFPPYLRQDVISEIAGMSSGSASNHVISFGEFCALYLNCWSLRSWNLELVEILERIQKDNKDSVLTQEVFNLLDNTAPEHDSNLKKIYQDSNNVRSSLFKLHFDKDSNAKYQLNPVNVEEPDKQQERFDLWLEKIRSRLKSELKEMAVFTKALPKVSRVLANVPCYMIFDDHEITDDWYLSQRWKNHVLSKHLGRDIIRNGLMAYAVFQDWGNVPDEYAAIPQTNEDTTQLTSRTQLLRKTSDYAFALSNNFSIATLRNDILEPIEELLGLGAQPSKVKWHYDVDTGPTKSYILDTRTRREYASLNSPPGLLSEEALLEQIPDTIPNGNAPFTFVISPAPVLGLGSFEELIQPAAAAVAGITSSTGRNPGFLVGMLKADYEAWGFNPKSFEALIERLSKLNKVIILSGDVHYGFSSLLDYWKGNSTTPEARILQFTSSALKNEEYGILHLYRSAMAQKMMTGIGDNLEKLGWNNKVLTLTGEVSIKNRFRLRQNPAVIPIAGWQSGATVNLPPDYRWRLKMLTDNSVRAADPFTSDFTRAPGEDDESLVLVNDSTTQEGYRNIVQRHQDNFISGVHRRMVWPANIGILKFEDDGGVWKVKHDYLFIQGKRSGSDSKAKAHIKHEASLEASGDDVNRPELP
jgi:hypothetical protein